MKKEAKFKVVSPYQPAGDQPEAIEKLSKSILKGNRYQSLEGVTGSGKTHTMARIIEKVQRPTIIMTHNKILAAQQRIFIKNSFLSQNSPTFNNLTLFCYNCLHKIKKQVREYAYTST